MNPPKYFPDENGKRLSTDFLELNPSSETIAPYSLLQRYECVVRIDRTGEDLKTMILLQN